MTRKNVAVAIILTLAFSWQNEAIRAAGTELNSARAVYGSILPALEKGTSVPLLLPTHLDRFDHTPALESTLYQSNAFGYELSIDPRGCHGTHACHYFTVAGATHRPPFFAAPHSWVRLGDGTIAAYQHSICGASCSDSTITWKHGAFWYLVGVKAGLRSEVLQLANSMRPFTRSL